MQFRITNSEEFELKYGEGNFPTADYAWSIVRGEDGGREKYKDCKHGCHDFEWMYEIGQYVCTFCLAVDDVVEPESPDNENDD